MKLIIAGSRTLRVSSAFIAEILEMHGVESIEEVISGTAAGIDRSGELFAEDHDLKLKKFPADWDKLGKAAGHIRNVKMAEYGTHLLLIWDGESKGSANMKKEMLGKPIFEVILRKQI